MCLVIELKSKMDAYARMAQNVEANHTAQPTGWLRPEPSGTESSPVVLRSNPETDTSDATFTVYAFSWDPVLWTQTWRYAS